MIMQQIEEILLSQLLQTTETSKLQSSIHKTIAFLKI